ncbi:MAG: hypothetical protein KY460_06490 [Actinobacteria bacterium]|nr:hypothetical protein [Actinomycetota bacterium]
MADDRDVTDLVSTDQRPASRAVADGLTASQVAQLQRIVRADPSASDDVERARAFTALAAADTSADTAELLTGVVADRSEGEIDRAVAAINLGLLATPTAVRGLVANLDPGSDQVLLRVVTALGWIGDAGALEALDDVDVDWPPLRRQLAFARALIASRTGRADPPIPTTPAGTPAQGPTQEVTLRALPPDEVARHLAQLRGTTYAVTPSASLGYELRSGDAQWTVFVNDAVVVDGQVHRLFEQRAIAALLARYDELTGERTVQYVALSQPVDAHVVCSVLRADGEVFASGRLRRDAGDVRLDISGVAATGSPAGMTAALEAGGEVGLQLPRRPPRRGEPITST